MSILIPKKMKTTRIIALVLLTSLMTPVLYSQTCKSIDASRLALPILRRQISGMEIVLNRTNSYIRLNGEEIRFDMGEERIKKPGYDWTYYANDIQSLRGKNVLNFENDRFYLYVEFEGNGSEIKGICPGCRKVFRDSRAPDFDWKSPRKVKIKLKPVAYDGSIAFDVESVDLIGRFEMGGHLDVLVPVLNALEYKMKKEIEKQAKVILNRPENKQLVANAFRGFVSMNRIDSVSRVYTTDNQLIFCE